MRVPDIKSNNSNKTLGDMLGAGASPAAANIPGQRIPTTNPIPLPGSQLKPSGTFEARETLGDTLYAKGLKMYLVNKLSDAEMAFLASKKYGGPSKFNADIDQTITRVRAELAGFARLGITPREEADGQTRQ